MTTKEKILEYLRSNPNATIQEIETTLQFNINTVRKAIERAKRKGELTKDKNGKYTITEVEIAKVEYKKELINEILDICMEDFRESEKISEKIELGKLIVKLLEKL